MTDVGKLLSEKKQHGKQKRIISGLAIIVVVSTLLAMMLPAVALSHREKVLACAYQPHVHEDACYADVLDAEGHIVDRVLTCGYADYFVHTHNDDCYDRDGNLVCPLPELEAHQHTDECYVTERVLSCGQEEAPAHTHTEDCYALTRGALTCAIPEHIHSDACYDSVLTCSLDHEHTEDCFEKVLSCGFEEHEHTDECYLMENTLVCGLEETAGHTHDDSCYAEVRTLVCDKPEVIPHIHNDSCYETILDEDGNVVAVNRVCGLPQVEVHIHDADCFYEIELTDDEVEELVRDEALSEEEPAEADEPDLTEEEDADEAEPVFFEEEDTDEDEPDLIEEEPTETDEPDLTEEDPAEEEQELSSPERGGVVGEADDGGVVLPDDEEENSEEEIVLEEEEDVTPDETEELLQEEGEDITPDEEDVSENGPVIFLPEDADTASEEPAEAPIDNNDDDSAASEEPEEAPIDDNDNDSAASEEPAEDGEASEEPSEEPAGPAMPAQRFAAETEDISVTVEAPEGAFPEGTEMRVALADEEQVIDAASEALPGEIVAARAVDITFVSPEGEELEPLVPIRVTLLPLTAPDAPEAEPVIVHMDGEGGIEVVAQLDETEQVLEVEGLEIDAVTAAEANAGSEEDAFLFEADAFSVYAILYTVDFHYEINGQTFDFSIPGGGVIGLRETLLTLGALTEDEAPEFMENIADVAFSDPALICVAQVAEDTTAGALMEALGLAPQYSAELTAEDIAELNAAPLAAPDWALISLLPFDTEETLTITMKNGDVFVLRVTDAQVSNADDLIIGEKYILYIVSGDGNYFALRDDGRTLYVENKDLDSLSNRYRWTYTENNEHTGAIWTCNGYKVNPYQANYHWHGNYWGDATLYNPSWTPISKLVPLDDGGFRFEDLNHSNRYLAYYEYYTRNYGDIIRPKLDDYQRDAISIHIYRPGTAYTVTLKANNDEFGHVEYTLNGTTYKTSATNSSIDISTVKDNEEFKAVLASIEAKPEEGYKFTGWTVKQVNGWDDYKVDSWGSGTADSNSATIRPSVNGNLILQANFEPIKLYEFTVTTNDESMGTVGGGDKDGETVEGQVSFQSITGVVINDKGKNAYELKAETKPLHKFVEWQLADSANNVIASYTTETINAKSINITGDGMTLTAVYREKTETEIDETDIDTLLDNWKAEMTSDFVGVDKTAHVTDYDNRIYEIDLSASSGKWAVERSINLDFITDTSRSMFFPANLDYAINTYSTKEANEEASSFTNLKEWLDRNGIAGETYYVISDDDTATMFAVYKSGSKWYFVDASYYYNTDGERRGNDKISEVPTKLKPGSNDTGYNVLSKKQLTGIIYKSSIAPDAYQKGYKPTSLNKYWSRLDYLYKAVMTATEALKSINSGSNVFLTTFNNTSTQEGFLKSKESEIYDQLRGVTPSGGTRQDHGLETARDGHNYVKSGNDYVRSSSESSKGKAFQSGSQNKQFAILITDGAPNGVEWGDDNSGIIKQANLLKAIKDKNDEPLTLMTLGLSLNFVGDSNKLSLASISSDSDKYAKEANNGGEIVKAIKDLVQTMVDKADMFGTVSDTLDPAFYPVEEDGSPVEANVYIDKDGNKYKSLPTDIPCYRWTKNGEEWTITYYNQTFKWPERDDNGNIITNGWEQSFHVKAKEDFLGGNTIETNKVGSTEFKATHTILLDANGNERSSTKKAIAGSDGKAKPITKSDVPTPHVNVKQLTLTQNETKWTVYVESEVDPLPQIKELYNNIKVLEVVSKSKDHMLTDKSDMLFPESEKDPENFLLKDVLGTVDWTTLTKAIAEGEDPAYVDLTYKRYDHTTGVIRLTLTKDGEKADYNKHNTSSNHSDEEKYVLIAQFIPYTAEQMIDYHGDETKTHDKLYHTTSQQSPGTEQMDGRPSVNTHIIDLFVRGLSITKANDTFETGLPGAEFTVYRPATEKEIADKAEGITTFEEGGRKYIPDSELNFDDGGVAYINGVKLLESPRTTYYLVETKAPDGYELREDPIPVILEVTSEYTPLPLPAEGDPTTQETKPTSGLYNWEEKAKLWLDTDTGVMRTTGAYDPDDESTNLTRDTIVPSSAYEVMYYRIANKPSGGLELPAAGGVGTTMFYAAGAAMTLLAGGLLLAKKRRASAAAER